MSNLYPNADQQEHMDYLASLPRERKCASGWHVVIGPSAERCDCGPYRPGALCRICGQNLGKVSPWETNAHLHCERRAERLAALAAVKVAREEQLT